MTVQHDDVCARLLQCALLCREVVRILGEARRDLHSQPSDRGRLCKCAAAAGTVCISRVCQRHARVAPQHLQHIDHCDDAKRVRWDRPRKDGVCQAVAQRGTCRPRRDDRQSGRCTNLSSHLRCPRAARTNDYVDTLTTKRVVRQVQRLRQARGRIAL
eukprot:7020240-Prymnesium_polylepis.2